VLARVQANMEAIMPKRLEQAKRAAAVA